VGGGRERGEVRITEQSFLQSGFICGDAGKRGSQKRKKEKEKETDSEKRPGNGDHTTQSLNLGSPKPT